MKTKIEPFSQIIGQRALLDEIRFHVENYGTTKVFPNCLLVAERGGGKSSLAYEIGRALGKPFHEILAKDLKDASALFNSVVIPLLSGREATVFIDEASGLTPDVTHSLLQILNPTRSRETVCKWKGHSFKFDFRKITFIFATTNPQKVEPDLKDRLQPFTFEQYSQDDLATILAQQTVNASYEPSVLHDFAATLRNNPRNATQRAANISDYAKRAKKKKIGRAEFKHLCEKLHILPLGLTKLEAQALKYVSEQPRMSLTTLAAKMHMVADAVRRDIETYLLSTGVIEIEAKGRSITAYGREILEMIA